MPIPAIQLHASGPEISRIVQGFGSIMHEESKTPRTLATYVDACLEVGITAYDLASVYSGGAAESAFGEVMAMRPGLRDRITIITKYGIAGGGEGYHCYDTSRKGIIHSVEQSLARMGIAHIDVLLMHRPDMLMNADEVAEALISLRREGKLLHAGVSNFLPHQVELLASRLPFPLVTNEVPYNLFDMGVQESGTLDQCQRLRMAPLYYSPLAGGRLFEAPRDAQAQRLRKALHTVAHEFGDAPIEQIAIAWLLRHPANGAAILGCGRDEWMRRAVGGAQIELTRAHWFYLWSASKGHEIP